MISIRSILNKIREVRSKRTTEFYTKNCRLYCGANIGEFTYGRPKVVHYNEDAKLEIGKFCSIAGDVVILLGGNHRTDWATTYPFPAIADWPSARGILGHPQSKGDVIIGNDVWIGTGATIFSGVTIGHGAVIGAQAVVTKSVEPYSIVVGNPIRVARMRFTEEQVSALLRICWWDWPIERIAKQISLLCSDRIDEFIRTSSGFGGDENEHRIPSRKAIVG